MSELDRRVPQLFALVTEALAGATDALLTGETGTGQVIVERDRTVDLITREVEQAVWDEIDSRPMSRTELRHLVGLLLILPELERSADLAEHIAQRAVKHLGAGMSPTSRGIVQRMSDLALEMWSKTAEAWREGGAVAGSIDTVDREIDLLRDRLLEEVATGTMAVDVAAQVTLLARFYERLGDHAVNLARRIATTPGLTESSAGSG